MDGCIDGPAQTEVAGVAGSETVIPAVQARCRVYNSLIVKSIYSALPASRKLLRSGCVKQSPSVQHRVLMLSDLLRRG